MWEIKRSSENREDSREEVVTKILSWDLSQCYFDSLKNCRQIVSWLWSVLCTRFFLTLRRLRARSTVAHLDDPFASPFAQCSLVGPPKLYCIQGCPLEGERKSYGGTNISVLKDGRSLEITRISRVVFSALRHSIWTDNPGNILMASHKVSKHSSIIFADFIVYSISRILTLILLRKCACWLEKRGSFDHYSKMQVHQESDEVRS